MTVPQLTPLALLMCYSRYDGWPGVPVPSGDRPPTGAGSCGLPPPDGGDNGYPHLTDTRLVSDPG